MSRSQRSMKILSQRFVQWNVVGVFSMMLFVSYFCPQELRLKVLQMGETPLIRCAHNGHLKTVEFLLEHGADVNALDLVPLFQLILLESSSLIHFCGWIFCNDSLHDNAYLQVIINSSNFKVCLDWWHHNVCWNFKDHTFRELHLTWSSEFSIDLNASSYSWVSALNEAFEAWAVVL